MEKHVSVHPFIAVVGHLVRDQIMSTDGKVTIALGGIAYNLATLCSLMEAGKVYPVCRIGLDTRGMLLDAFDSYNAMDGSGIAFNRHPNVLNRLVYRSDGCRDEWNSRRPSPLSLKRVPGNVDAVIINFISGNDVRLKELKEFRKQYRGLIYCDFHSLALGRGKDGRRYYRFHPRWREYLSAVDIIQMNLHELSSIVNREPTTPEDIAFFCKRLLEAGPSIAIVTNGEAGTTCSMSSSKRSYYVPAVHVPVAVDPTGCGDALGAAFVYHYLQTGDPLKSMELASQIAAAKATFSGVEAFGNLRMILKTLAGPMKVVAI
jgi:sugar/nucleoside kinase (ribokinase family)